MCGLDDIEKIDRHFLEFLQHDRKFFNGSAANVIPWCYGQWPLRVEPGDLCHKAEGQWPEVQFEHSQIIDRLIQNTSHLG